MWSPRLFITEQVARWLRLAADLGNVTFAFLRPPVETCIQRRRGRRAESGLDPDKFNAERLRATWDRLDLHFRRFADAGARCVWLNWENPLPDLEALLPRVDAGVAAN